MAIHEVAKRLAPRHDVTVVCGGYPGARSSVVDGVAYHFIGSKHNPPRVGQLLFHGHLIRAVRRLSFDVWIENFTPPFSTSFLPSFTAKPVVGLCHLLAGREMARKYGGIPFHRIEARGLRTYRQVIVLTDYSAEVVRGLNPKTEIFVIPNGVTLDRVDPGPASKTRDEFLVLGRIAVHQKGLDLLLDAVSMVASRLPWVVTIAGAGSPKDENLLRRRIAAVGRTVRFLGPVSGGAKTELISRCGALLMTSRFETQPLSVLEGFSMAKPLVWFDIPHLKWISRGCGFTVPPWDVEAFGGAMCEMASSEKRRHLFGQEALSFSGRFNWDLIAREYELLISRVGDPAGRGNLAVSR